MQQDKYFFCYSPVLHKYLHNKCKIPYITGALHEKTNNKFWLYEKNDKLNKCITEYKNLFE